MVLPFSSLIALFCSCTGDFSWAFSSFGLTCPNLSTFPLIILFIGFMISVLIVFCCNMSGAQVSSGEFCCSVVTDRLSFCAAFLLLGAPFWFLGARLEPLFPFLLFLSATWVLLKQLAMTNGVGLHLNSSFLASSLHGNSSSKSWSQYRSFRFGRFIPSQPL